MLPGALCPPLVASLHTTDCKLYLRHKVEFFILAVIAASDLGAGVNLISRLSGRYPGRDLLFNLLLCVLSRVTSQRYSESSVTGKHNCPTSGLLLTPSLCPYSFPPPPHSNLAARRHHSESERDPAVRSHVKEATPCPQNVHATPGHLN